MKEFVGINELWEKIIQAKHVVITSHKSPDGDAVGSSLALKHFLEKHQLDVEVVLPDIFPHFLKWLPCSNHISIYDFHPANVTERVQRADVIFCLDYNEPSRVGNSLSALITESDAVKVMIDHHVDPAEFVDYCYSDTSQCSTAQMVYQFIEALGQEGRVDQDIAACLYTGIVTDSGSFRFSSVDAETHRITARLLETGLNHAEIHQNIYDCNTKDRLNLVGYALSNKLEVIEDGKVAFVQLTLAEMERFNFKKGDTEGLVNYALSIQGVEIAAFFRESEDITKISFRSKKYAKVNQLSSDNFEGGGHVHAAGGRGTNGLQDAVDRFRQVVAKYL